MRNGPLQNLLQPDSLFGNEIVFNVDRFQMLVEKAFQFPPQPVHFAAAGKHHIPARVLEQQGVQDVLGRQKFMMSTLGFPDSEGKCNLDILVEHILS